MAAGAPSAADCTSSRTGGKASPQVATSLQSLRFRTKQARDADKFRRVCFLGRDEAHSATVSEKQLWIASAGPEAVVGHR